MSKWLTDAGRKAVRKRFRLLKYAASRTPPLNFSDGLNCAICLEINVLRRMLAGDWELRVMLMGEFEKLGGKGKSKSLTTKSLPRLFWTTKSLPKILELVKKNCGLFGWKGSDGGLDAWLNGDEDNQVCIGINCRRKPSKEKLKKIKKIFNTNNVKFYDEGYTGTAFVILEFGRGDEAFE